MPNQVVGEDANNGKTLILYLGKKSAKNYISNFTSDIPAGFNIVKKFGYQHGQKVYEYKGKYYSKDVDSHNEGVWKVFVEVGGKLKRIGTADADLNIFKN